MDMPKVIVVVASLLLAFSDSTHAFSIGGWEPLKTVEQVVTAPTNTLIGAVDVVVNGGNPAAILDPLKSAAASAAPVPNIVASAVTWPQDQLYQEAMKASGKVGGPAGDFVFDAATFTQRYYSELTKSAGAVASNTLLGQNPLQFVAMPLAAAVRQAREKHISSAKPLPDHIKMPLMKFFRQEVLDRAKYSVGNIDITLPNGIGQVQKYMSGKYAVVVDDIIVFNSEPPSFFESPFWWAHEVTHVEQYMQWGIEDFALRYVSNYRGNIEGPADARGDQASAWADNVPSDGVAVTLSAVAESTYKHYAKTEKIKADSQPLLPANYQQVQAQLDPPILRFYFPSDNQGVEYYGTRSGRIIVVDSFSRNWMQIGWAVPPDIAGPAWIYLIPGRASYDVFPSGHIMQRVTFPFGPSGPPGPPVQVGYVARLQ